MQKDSLFQQIIEPLGRTVTYTYDGRFNFLTITDARGITYLANTYATGTNHPLDPAVATQTLADGSVSRIDYVVTNQTITQATVTDPRGNKTAHRFNGRNQPVSTVDGLGQQMRMTRDFTSNQVLEVRDPLNRLTKFTYDLAGNVNSVLDPQQNPTIFEYETVFNRATKITDALNQQTRFTYNSTNGNLLSTIDSLDHAIAISYNQFGQPISVTDALNQTTTFEYDEVGNLIATADPLGNRTLRFYDAVSRLVAIVDARGKSTQFTYDALNRVTQIQDAINGLTSFTYDPNGNLLTVTDAKNQTTTYTYDNMDRLATRKDALNRTENYQYDLAGNLTTFTDRKNQVATFQYDALNRRTTATYADAITMFTYDTVGRLVKASDSAPGAGAIDFAYDILDRLTQETTGQGTVNYQYDVLGRRTQMMANGQQPVMYQYDPASRLTQVGQGSLFAAFGYDNANRRTSLGYSNGTSTSYGYDVASRLTNITHNGPSGIIDALTYTYDAAGNRFSATRANGTASLLPSVVATAAYDAANEQTQFAGATLQYDATGNLTNDGVNTYQWDARNRLIGISGGATATFAYDPLGRRTQKTLSTQSSALSTGFLYDGNDITAEIGGGAVGAHYLRSLNIDEPFIRQAGTGNEHYHTDALGSSLALSDATGASVATYGYEPFGKTTVTGSSSNALRYTGRENEEGGLYYHRARYYNPGLQRFISEDPIGIAGGDANRYAYVGNAPLNWSDPSGLRVYISGHTAAGPVGQLWTTPPSYHLSLVLIPDNPAPFQGQPGWGPDPGNGVGPYPSQTLSAHSDISLKLRSTPNYSSDNLQSGQYSQIISTPSGMTDAQFINNLVKASSCFHGVPYSTPDQSGYMASGKYNSNSYVSGLIVAAGGTPPPLNTNGQWQAPGYSNSIPSSSSGKSCGRQ